AAGQPSALALSSADPPGQPDTGTPTSAASCLICAWSPSSRKTSLLGPTTATLAQPDKLRWLGDEVPARPQGVSTRCHQRRQQPSRVKSAIVVSTSVVATGAGECPRAEHHGLV